MNQEPRDDEKIDADGWRGLYMNIVDIALVLVLFIFIGFIGFTWGYYRG